MDELETHDAELLVTIWMNNWTSIMGSLKGEERLLQLPLTWKTNDRKFDKSRYRTGLGAF